MIIDQSAKIHQLFENCKPIIAFFYQNHVNQNNRDELIDVSARPDIRLKSPKGIMNLLLLFTDCHRSVTEVVLVTPWSEEVDALTQSLGHLVLHHPLTIDSGC